MKYAAIMFDVVESRKYYDRYDVQNVLMGCVDYLNTIYEQGIKKKVVSSAGDEFQGLFLDLFPIYTISCRMGNEALGTLHNKGLDSL